MRRIPLAASALVFAAAAASALRAESGDTAPGSLVAAPREVDPRVGRVGELIADASATLADGTTKRLSACAGPKGLVIVARSEACPVGRKYGPSLAGIEKDAKRLGFGVLYLNVAAADGADAVAAAAKSYALTAPYALDPQRVVARELRATSTTEVFVLDAARTLRYRGAVDDQYGLGYQLAEPRRPYLRLAMETVAAGGRPLIESTSAPGCVVTLDAPPDTAAGAGDAAAPVTWHNRISRIVDRNCVECHRDGESAPFPLVTRKDVLAQREMVRLVVEARSMPPWFATADYGDFATDRRLSERDRADFLAWLDGGAPVGDPKDAAQMVERVKGWKVGAPDLVLEGKEFAVPAAGVVEYQYRWIDAAKEEDRWVRAVEVRSSAPEVVHHVLVFPRFPKKDPRSKTQGPFDGGLTGYFAATVPGHGYFVYPEGMAKKWPAGTQLFVQVHYTPNGKAVKDRPTIGIVFAKGPPREEVRTRGIFNAAFQIPAGADRYPVQQAFTFPQAGRILEFMPHMHVRGTAFRYELELPDGTKRTLLDVPRYDFNWQLVYRLREPIEVPRGARLQATGWFDNSAKNPANPDPSRIVPFGEQTSDEMMIGYFDWIPAEAAK